MEEKVTFWQKCRSGIGGFPEILSKNSPFLDKKHQTKKGVCTSLKKRYWDTGFFPEILFKTSPLVIFSTEN